jgi:predicted NBD/HSP70 family sugar kinase
VVVVTTAKPTLEMLRSLTDEHVLRALMAHRRLTRAELATRTRLSKPTVSESVRRLCAASVVADTGERTTGRGRIGSYYALADDVGAALVVGVAPEGIVAEVLDAHADVISQASADVSRPARPEQVAAVLEQTARQVQERAGRPLRLAVVSAADPVDRSTGRTVHLADAPFLLGELSAVDVLAPLVDGPVLVDNDVNWAAQAERDACGGMNDVAYVHLGEGVGCAILSDGSVRRGHAGLVGEIAHVLTVGPDQQAVPFITVFEALGLRRHGSTAVDVEAVLGALQNDDEWARQVQSALPRAICGVLAAVVAFADPEVVVLGGSWGPAVLDAVAANFTRLPRHVPVRAARVTDQPSLAGARSHALRELRTAIIGAAGSATR